MTLTTHGIPPEPNLYQEPDKLLQALVRFDTSNPPGQEAGCITYIDQLLTKAGFETTILAKDPERPNLIARLKGTGNAPPLLLYGHVDVVPTTKQTWTHPPFEAQIVDGYIWGRGTLDMKGGVAMMLAALLRAKAEGLTPAGDIVFTALSDEEAGGDYGAKYLVEHYPEHFEGIRYALGEFGGATMYIGDKTFYPIQIAEKQVCWLKATLRGPGGHGSRVIRGGTMAKLGRFLQLMDQNTLPIHVTPSARQMIGTMAAGLPFPTGFLLKQLLNPGLANSVLKLMGEQAATFEPMLRNTVNATIVSGGEKVNVIPSEIVLEMDGRLLPGYTPDDMQAEIHAIVGDMVELEVLRHDPYPAEPDMGLFDTLGDVLRDLDPEGVPLPMLLPAVTDGRFFARLGIQTYGFTPMKLPKDFKYFEAIHAADERVPVKAVEFGADAIYKVLQRYGQ
ncbi:MAG: M20/M25/M40 family metallo-hydrolase [Anaerolineae bacterium]|nr:M20/M25/M40 family metallo-hydrolase [Anaerolineae bacterium]